MTSRRKILTPYAPFVAMVTALALTACTTTTTDPTPPDPVDPPLPDPIDPTGALFEFEAPGDLAPGSGTGTTDDTIYLPGIRFPIEVAPAYTNTQVYAAGGSNPPPGASPDQCSSENYSYPWRDNFCEFRVWDMPLCPSGKGHQGVDLRPATCEKSKHWAVATEDGFISGIGRYTVTLVSNTGTQYRYMHLDMSNLAVGFGDEVERGDRLGLVSNDFGGAPTTIHLHFDVKQAVALPTGETVSAFIPPYTSLVEAYEQLLVGDDQPSP